MRSRLTHEGIKEYMNTTSVPTPVRANPVVHLGLPRLRASGAAPADRPRVPELIDRFGRVARDLRVSLTDKCNLRCTYCMPPEGVQPAPGERILTDAEVVRLVRIAVERLGVREVRFTGGEPLLRKGLEEIVAATSSLCTDVGTPVETSLTTNALGLRHRARGLKEAGLTRVNVSMDAADRETYAALTRRDRFDDAVAGARAAAEAGLLPVKVNAVLVRGVNDAQAVRLVAEALASGYELRFIEQMPLGPSGQWTRSGMVVAEEILSRLEGAFELVARPGTERGSSPAELWDVAPGKVDGVEHPGGTVGVIASITRPFCGDCDRTRLTADGQVRSCLFAREETDLRSLLRAGADDDTIADAWRAAMWGKQPGHGVDDPSFLQPSRTMSAIGG